MTTLLQKLIRISSHLTKPKIAAQVPPHWRRRSRYEQNDKITDTATIQSPFNRQQLASQVSFPFIGTSSSSFIFLPVTKAVVPTPRCGISFPLREKPLPVYFLSHPQQRTTVRVAYSLHRSHHITSDQITPQWIPRQQISQRSN